MDTNLIELLKAACHDDSFFEAPEGFEEVEEGEWTQDYKYQQSTTIVKHTESGRCFEVHQRRSGSYHTDWYYCEPQVGNEVRKVKKLVEVEQWESV